MRTDYIHLVFLHLSLFISFVFCSSASAADTTGLHVAGPLLFKDPVVTGFPKLEDDAVKGVFVFTNTQKEKVTVLSLRPVCGCTTAELEKRVYGPGEGGQITAILDLTHMSGPQRKRIEVTTQVGAKTFIQDIAIKVDIPSPAKLEPDNGRIWIVGRDVGPQSVKITLVPGAKIDSIDQPDNGAYTAKLVPGSDQLHAQIVMTPKTLDLKKSLSGIMHMKIALPNGKIRDLILWGVFIVRTEQKP